MQSKISLIFLGIVIFAFVFSMFSFTNKMQETIKNRKIIEEKITQLEKSKEQLSSEIIKLNTDKGVEESIREKFGLGKVGENMILVIEDKNKIEVKEEPDSLSFWFIIKGWFK